MDTVKVRQIILNQKWSEKWMRFKSFPLSVLSSIGLSSFTVYLKVEDWNTCPEIKHKHLVLHSHLKLPYYDLKISLFCICNCTIRGSQFLPVVNRVHQQVSLQVLGRVACSVVSLVFKSYFPSSLTEMVSNCWVFEVTVAFFLFFVWGCRNTFAIQQATNNLHFIRFNSSPAGFVPKLPQPRSTFKTFVWE